MARRHVETTTVVAAAVALAVAQDAMDRLHDKAAMVAIMAPPIR